MYKRKKKIFNKIDYYLTYNYINNYINIFKYYWFWKLMFF